MPSSKMSDYSLVPFHKKPNLPKFPSGKLILHNMMHRSDPNAGSVVVVEQTTEGRTPTTIKDKAKAIREELQTVLNLLDAYSAKHKNESDLKVVFDSQMLRLTKINGQMGTFIRTETMQTPNLHSALDEIETIIGYLAGVLKGDSVNTIRVNGYVEELEMATKELHQTFHGNGALAIGNEVVDGIQANADLGGSPDGGNGPTVAVGNVAKGAFQSNGRIYGDGVQLLGLVKSMGPKKFTENPNKVTDEGKMLEDLKEEKGEEEKSLVKKH